MLVSSYFDFGVVWFVLSCGGWFSWGLIDGVVWVVWVDGLGVLGIVLVRLWMFYLVVVALG